MSVKRNRPACCSRRGKFACSLLEGHKGGHHDIPADWHWGGGTWKIKGLSGGYGPEYYSEKEVDARATASALIQRDHGTAEITYPDKITVEVVRS